MRALKDEALSLDTKDELPPRSLISDQNAWSCAFASAVLTAGGGEVTETASLKLKFKALPHSVFPRFNGSHRIRGRWLGSLSGERQDPSEPGLSRA